MYCRNLKPLFSANPSKWPRREQNVQQEESRCCSTKVTTLKIEWQSIMIAILFS